MLQKAFSRCCANFAGMATALQDVTLKRGNKLALKFRAGTKVDSILRQLAAVCPGARIEDTEGFVVTLGCLKNLTQKEYTVIDPTPAGASACQLACNGPFVSACHAIRMNLCLAVDGP